MSHLKHFRERPPQHRQQSGFIMLIVAIFLMILMAGSAQIFSRITDDTVTSGTVRDSSESLMLAEAAMQYLRGQFYGTLDTVTESPTDGLDQDIAAQIKDNMEDPDDFLFAYMFYSTAGAGLDQNQPSILQRIANGEATNIAAEPVTTNGIAVDTTPMRINDLFGGTGNPMLYILNTNGLLTDSEAADWEDETSAEKAAVWIEVVQSPSNSSSVEVFLQAAAQVGNSKSYVQRYIGSYNNELGTLSAVAEARNFI